MNMLNLPHRRELQVPNIYLEKIYLILNLVLKKAILYLKYHKKKNVALLLNIPIMYNKPKVIKQ